MSRWLLLLGLSILFFAASCSGSSTVSPPSGNGPAYSEPDAGIFLFENPITGNAYQVPAREVIVNFKGRIEMSELGTPIDPLREPRIAALVQAEHAEVMSLWFTSFAVKLAPGHTIREAMLEWPTRYPDLVSSVTPNYLLTYD
jgi:hypothetical protein